MQASQLSGYVFKINGMSCGHCVKKVEDIVLNLNEVSSVQIDLDSGKASIVGGNSPEIIQAITEAGYPTEQLFENSHQSKPVLDDNNDAIKACLFVCSTIPYLASINITTVLTLDVPVIIFLVYSICPGTSTMINLRLRVVKYL